MIKWLLIIWQVFSVASGFSKAKSPSDYLEESLVKAKDYFLFTVGCAIATFFMLVAIVVFIIAAGLQIEQNGGLSFTGLMISASLFLAVSLFCYFISFVILILKKQKMLERARQIERERASSSHVMPIVEEILKAILAKMSQSNNPAGPPPPTSNAPPTADKPTPD